MNFAFAIYCLANLVVFASAAPEPNTAAEINADVALKAKECAEEFKISPETLKELQTSAIKSTFDASDDLMCYSKCVSDKIGLFDGDKWNLERIVEVNVAAGKEESKVRASTAICREKAVAEKLEKIDCNTAWALYTCFADNLLMQN